jgi:hypothetical protein
MFNMPQVELKKSWPYLVLVAVLVITAYLLRSQGRLWSCSCGRILLWSGNIWSSDNSQHLFDPYSFTHLLHGFAFCWLLTLCVPRIPLVWRFSLAVIVESLWEVIENSEFIIRRYREATMALGYTGDTIINSLGDILMCAAGFAIAQQIGFRRSLVIFAMTEVILLLWIRDSLILNVVMLIYPIDAIRAWQTGN